MGYEEQPPIHSRQGIIMEKSYDVTVEGLVSRVICVLAHTEAEAIAEAKQEFTSSGRIKRCRVTAEERNNG